MKKNHPPRPEARVELDAHLREGVLRRKEVGEAEPVAVRADAVRLPELRGADKRAPKDEAKDPDAVCHAVDGRDEPCRADDVQGRADHG